MTYFSQYPLNSAETEILFIGLGPLPPRSAESKQREIPDNWFSILESAFMKRYLSTEEEKRLYGDPERGATLEQTCLSFGA